MNERLNLLKGLTISVLFFFTKLKVNMLSPMAYFHLNLQSYVFAVSKFYTEKKNPETCEIF